MQDVVVDEQLDHQFSSFPKHFASADRLTFSFSLEIASDVEEVFEEVQGFVEASSPLESLSKKLLS